MRQGDSELLLRAAQVDPGEDAASGPGGQVRSGFAPVQELGVQLF